MRQAFGRPWQSGVHLEGRPNSRPMEVPALRRIPMLLRRARVGHLATADRRGQPYVVPICFVFDGYAIFTPIDKKPKRVAPRQLRRVRNIDANARVALMVDAYREDWRRLWHILVLGTAKVIQPGATDHERAVQLLRRKYRQYRTMRLEDSLVLQIAPHRITSWRAGTRSRIPRSS